MTTLDSIVLEASDPAAIEEFLQVLGVSDRVGVRFGDAPTTGYRGFVLSIGMAQPASVDALVEAALAAGATTLKPVAKSLWGYGGVIQGPDGTIWKVVSASKKNTGPASREIDNFVLLLGVEDVLATKQFYVEQGLEVKKSFGRKYVEFASTAGKTTLALYGRKAAAKDVGVAPEGSGSRRIVLGTENGPFTDPDGFTWEKA